MAPVRPGGLLKPFEVPFLKGLREVTSQGEGLRRGPELHEEPDEGGDPAPEPPHTLRPLDPEGPARIVADELQPRPRRVEGGPDEARVPHRVGELRVGIPRELEEAVEGLCLERRPRGVLLPEQLQERLRVRPPRRGGDPDPPALGCVQEDRNRDVPAGPGEEVLVVPGHRLVERIDPPDERPRVRGGGGRLRDLPEAIDLRAEGADAGLDGPVGVTVRLLEASDLRGLVRGLVELPPGLAGPVEVPFLHLSEGEVEHGDVLRGEALLLRGPRDVPREGVDVPNEDLDLAPVVDLALPDQAVDPLAEPVQGAVEDPRDPLDPLPRPGDLLEELLRFPAERIPVEAFASRHGGSGRTSGVFRFGPTRGPRGLPRRGSPGPPVRAGKA